MLRSKVDPWLSSTKSGSPQQPQSLLAALLTCQASTSRVMFCVPSRTPPHAADLSCASCATLISFTTPISLCIWTKSMAVRSSTARGPCTSWSSLAADPLQRKRSDLLCRTSLISNSFRGLAPRVTHSPVPRRCPDVKLLAQYASKRISSSTATSWHYLARLPHLRCTHAPQLGLTVCSLLPIPTMIQQPLLCRAVLLSLPC